MTLRIRNILGAVAIFLAVVFAWFWQGVWLSAMLESPGKGRLEKDALGFYELATHPSPFYAASLREPLFPVLLRAGLKLFHPADEHLFVRQFTGSIGLALIIAIGALGWRLSGPISGALAAWLFTVSTYTVYYAISGLRETTVLFLGVALTLLLLVKKQTWWQLAGLGLISIALPLIRFEYLGVIPLIMTGWVALADRDWKPRLIPAALAVVMAWTFALPFLIACKKEMGGYFALTANHATYWRNHEFAGQPGYLTREEVMANPYGGKRVSTGDYMFHDHSVPQVIVRYMEGYWISFTKHIPTIFSWADVRDPLIWFWLVGLAWSVRNWRTAGIVPWVMLAVQFPFAFIVPLNTVLPGRLHAGVEFRFSLPLAPFAAVLAAVGIVEIGKWISQRWWARQDLNL